MEDNKKRQMEKREKRWTIERVKTGMRKKE